MDSEDDSRIGMGVVRCRNSRTFSKTCRTRERTMRGTIWSTFWSLRWRRCCAERTTAPTWRMRLEHGIPSHDTFSRIFRLLDPQAFEPVFRRFLAEFAKELHGVVAVDGKALRGAFERGRKTTPLQLVNVWAAEARLAIAQRLAPDRKSTRLNSSHQIS